MVNLEQSNTVSLIKRELMRTYSKINNEPFSRSLVKKIINRVFYIIILLLMPHKTQI